MNQIQPFIVSPSCRLWPSLRIALLASAAAVFSVAAASPAALAAPLTFTTYTNATSGFSTSNFVTGVYASGSNIYAATSAGLSISTNGGSNWSNYTSSDGLGSNYVSGVYASGSNIYAATSGGLSISTNGGTNWTNKTAPPWSIRT